MLSTLVSSSFQRLSSALARHAFSESVNFASLSLFRLIRSFHKIAPAMILVVFSIIKFFFSAVKR